MVNPNDVNRDNFLKKLASMTPEDINKLIREKGKKPRLPYPFIKVPRGYEGVKEWN